jgi:hypothetical protein
MPPFYRMQRYHGSWYSKSHKGTGFAVYVCELFHRHKEGLAEYISPPKLQHCAYWTVVRHSFTSKPALFKAFLMLVWVSRIVPTDNKAQKPLFFYFRRFSYFVKTVSINNLPKRNCFKFRKISFKHLYSRGAG